MRSRSLFPLAALALALAASACLGDDLPVVTTAAVTPGEVVEVVAAPGRVEPAARQAVAATVPGQVAAITVADGAVVTAGQAIVELTSTQVTTAQEQAAAAQRAARQGTSVSVPANADATRAAARTAVGQLDATIPPRVAELRARAAAADDDRERAAAEAAADAVEAAYLSTRAALLAAAETAAAQQEAASAALATALEDTLRQLGAPQRAQADAAVAAAAQQASELVLVAPFDGIVQFGSASSSSGPSLPAGLPADLAGAAGALGGAAAGGDNDLRVGAPVAPGQTLFTVYDLSTPFVVADVDEIDAPSVTAGQRARVIVDAVAESLLEGVVETVPIEAQTTQAGGVGYPVRLRVVGPPEAAAALRVGMTATVEIVTASLSSPTVVPSRALLGRDTDSAVFVVRAGVARRVAVDVEALGEETAAVRARDGARLEPDDLVVVGGYEDLEDGDAVRIGAAGSP